MYLTNPYKFSLLTQIMNVSGIRTRMTVMVEKLQIWIYSYWKCLQQPYLISNVDKECEHCVVNCQYGHITIEDEHKWQCPKFPITSPNN